MSLLYSQFFQNPSVGQLIGRSAAQSLARLLGQSVGQSVDRSVRSFVGLFLPAWSFVCSLAAAAAVDAMAAGAAVARGDRGRRYLMIFSVHSITIQEKYTRISILRIT